MPENENDLTVTKYFHGKYEKVTSDNMLSVLRYLEEKIQSGECVALAFAAIGQEGRAARGYAGAVKEQRYMVSGTLSALSHDILEDMRERAK